MTDNPIARQYSNLRNTLETHLEPLNISVVSILVGETDEAYEVQLIGVIPKPPVKDTTPKLKGLLS